jgi:hypothetical protein
MPPRVLEVGIKDQFGHQVHLPCCPEDTVESLRARYCQRTGDEPRLVELFWQKRYLVPAATLEACKIHHGDTLFANRYQVQQQLQQQQVQQQQQFASSMHRLASVHLLQLHPATGIPHTDGAQHHVFT